MKTYSLARFIGPLLLAMFCFTATKSWARLPKPIEAAGVLLAVDMNTQTLVFKPGNNLKPLVLDWNKDTQFFQAGQVANPSALTTGVAVVIHYKRLSFRNPLLKKVSQPPVVNRP
jgi:hypothetical protein